MNIGISPAAASQYLHGKRKLSMKSAHKVAHWAGFNIKETNYFLLLVQREASQDLKQKKLLEMKLNLIRENACPDEEREIRELLERTEVHRSYMYALKDLSVSHSALRMLTFLCDKKTGQRVPEFLDSGISPHTKIAFTAYFFPNADGSFRSYADSYFEDQAGSNVILKQNTNVNVEQDRNGFPQIYGGCLRRFGVSRYVLADLFFSTDRFLITGTEMDDYDPDYRKPVETLFLREGCRPG